MIRYFALFSVACVAALAQTPGTRGNHAIVRVASRPGYLGAGVLEVTPERAKALKLPWAAGVEIKHVDDNSAASRAGLKLDDVILEVNKEKVEGLDDFLRLIAETPPGTKVTLTVWREGARRMLYATLDARPNLLLTFPGPDGQIPVLPPIEVIPLPAPLVGIDGESLTPQLAQYFGVECGVLVRSVDMHSPADKAGVKAGDVITKVNGTVVTSPREVVALIRVGHKPVVFTVVRNHRMLTLNIELASVLRREGDGFERNLCSAVWA
jgi:serine protease Do